MSDDFFDILTGAWKTRLLTASLEEKPLPPRMQRALDKIYPHKIPSPNMLKQMKRMVDYWKDLPYKAPIPEGSEEDYLNYMEAQEEKAQYSLDSFLNQVDMSGVKRILDVGGGTAPYLRKIQQRFPLIESTYMDIKSAAILARQKGLKGKIISGDFRTSDWGRGFDALLISQVIHMYDDDTVGMLFKKAAMALAKGARLIIIEHFIDPGDDPFNFLFDINMCLGTDGGKLRTRKEVENLAKGAFKLEKEYFIDKRTGVMELKRSQCENK